MVMQSKKFVKSVNTPALHDCDVTFSMELCYNLIGSVYRHLSNLWSEIVEDGAITSLS